MPFNDYSDPEPDIPALLDQAAEKYGLDPALVHTVAGIESNYNPNAISPKGARGVMQVMPATAKSYGVTDPKSVAQNIDAGARYLRDLNQKYGGDPASILGAYNAGEPRFDAWKGHVPYKETREYVAKGMKRLRELGPKDDDIEEVNDAPRYDTSIKDSDLEELPMAAPQKPQAAAPSGKVGPPSPEGVYQIPAGFGEKLRGFNYFGPGDATQLSTEEEKKHQRWAQNQPQPAAPAPVRGMEQLGPLPGAPQTPALPLPIEQRIQQTTPGNVPEVGSFLHKLVNTKDIPQAILDTTTGAAGQFAQGVENFATVPNKAAIARALTKVVINPRDPSAYTELGAQEPGLRQTAEAGHQAVSGAFGIAAPFMLGAGAAAPVTTAVTLGAGIESQQLVEDGLVRLGLPKEYAAVAGDLTALIVGHYSMEGMAALRAKIAPILQARMQTGTPPPAEAPIEGRVRATTADGTVVEGEHAPHLAQFSGQHVGPDETAILTGEGDDTNIVIVPKKSVTPVEETPAATSEAPAATTPPQTATPEAPSATALPTTATTPPETATTGTNLAAQLEAMRAENERLKAQQQEAAPPEPEAPKLPKELSGARPKFGYGPDNYTLKFDSDLDKAAYITAQKVLNKRHGDYLKFVMDNTGLDEAGAIQHGNRVKETIKYLIEHGGGDENGVIQVPDLTQFSEVSLGEEAAPAAPAAPATETVRLYRGQPAGEFPPANDRSDAGRWFTPDRDQTLFYGGDTHHVDIPRAQYEQLLSDEAEHSRTAPGSNPLRGAGGVLLPPEDANRAVLSPEAPALPETGQATAPPGVNVGDLPPAAPPEPSAAGSTYMGSLFGALQPVFDKVTAQLKEAKDLWNERQQSLAAIARATTPPMLKEVGKLLLQDYTGERDSWVASVNQVISELRKTVPNKLDQEAISLMRDFRNNPQELTAWRNGVHPAISQDPVVRAKTLKFLNNLKPVIDRALNPTPAMQQADVALTAIAAQSLAEGRARGFLDSSIDPHDYVPHMFFKEGDLPLSDKSRAHGDIGRNFAFGQERFYPTMLDAVAAGGNELRTMNAFDAFNIHAKKFATARATRMMGDQLSAGGIGKWAMSSQNVPRGWQVLAPQTRLFHKLGAYTDQAGVAHPVDYGYYVHPFVAEAMRPVTDAYNPGKVTQWFRDLQRKSKAIELSVSLFHLGAETHMAVANMGWKFPKAIVNAVKSDWNNPVNRGNELDLIHHGGTTSVQGETYEAFKNLRPSATPGWDRILNKVPGPRQVNQLAEGITKLTFDRVQRWYKVTDYAMKRDAWLKDNPNATPFEITQAKRSIAKQINSTYGGLHWENLGWNRSNVETARLLLLAPDWLFSNVQSVKNIWDPRNLGYAGAKAMRERFAGSPAARAQRAFWVKTAVYGAASTQALSLMYTGQPSDRPTEVYMGEDSLGRKIYQNVFFKGAPGDLVTLVGDMHDYGALVGTMRFMANKMAPLIRAAPRFASGVDYTGRKLIDPNISPTAKNLRGLGILARETLPVPFVGQTIVLPTLRKTAEALGMERTAEAIGLDMSPAGERQWKEILQSVIAGQAPKHIAPEGMRLSSDKDSLVTAPPKPEPTWDDWSQAYYNRPTPPR
jgi:hypothetical protein